jgi:hypothetical protein
MVQFSLWIRIHILNPYLMRIREGHMALEKDNSRICFLRAECSLGGGGDFSILDKKIKRWVRIRTRNVACVQQLLSLVESLRDKSIHALIYNLASTVFKSINMKRNLCMLYMLMQSKLTCLNMEKTIIYYNQSQSQCCSKPSAETPGFKTMLCRIKLMFSLNETRIYPAQPTLFLAD